MCIASQLMSLSHFLSSFAYEGVLINRFLNTVNQNSSPVLRCCPTFGFVYKRILDLKLVNSSGTTTNRGMLAVFIFILMTATPSPLAHSPGPLFSP